MRCRDAAGGANELQLWQRAGSESAALVLGQVGCGVAVAVNPPQMQLAHGSGVQQHLVIG